MEPFGPTRGAFASHFAVDNVSHSSTVPYNALTTYGRVS